MTSPISAWTPTTQMSQKPAQRTRARRWTWTARARKKMLAVTRRASTTAAACSAEAGEAKQISMDKTSKFDVQAKK